MRSPNSGLSTRLPMDERLLAAPLPAPTAGDLSPRAKSVSSHTARCRTRNARASSLTSAQSASSAKNCFMRGQFLAASSSAASMLSSRRPTTAFGTTAPAPTPPASPPSPPSPPSADADAAGFSDLPFSVSAPVSLDDAAAGSAAASSARSAPSGTSSVKAVASSGAIVLTAASSRRATSTRTPSLEHPSSRSARSVGCSTMCRMVARQAGTCRSMTEMRAVQMRLNESSVAACDSVSNRKLRAISTKRKPNSTSSAPASDANAAASAGA
mmetsp:Transcript_22960/g.80119  ORF Transcript_22960/g.80119 Transcript_22960/m.80119 type:complete len:270 (+) Transcript_22960:522-1331(+)